jgi:hypothetical protein
MAACAFPVASAVPICSAARCSAVLSARGRSASRALESGTISSPTPYCSTARACALRSTRLSSAPTTGVKSSAHASGSFFERCFGRLVDAKSRIERDTSQ